MKITKSTVKTVVEMLRMAGHTNQEIEDNFKIALKQKAISVDIYSMAMEEIYK